MATQWLITGAGGQLGSVLLGMLTRRGAVALGTVSRTGPRPAVGDVAPVDLADADTAIDALRDVHPKFIVHAAAVTNVNDAFRDPERARCVNVVATQRLSEMAADAGARFVLISTDLVFDGTTPPYGEDAEPRPLSIYGKTKAEAESTVSGADHAAVLRLPLMYGIPEVERETTFMSQLRALFDRRELSLFQDEYRTPLWLEDAARACIDVAQSDVTGVIHAGGPERLSRLEMIEIAAAALDIPDPRIRSISQSALVTPEPRPADVSLESARYRSLFHHAPGVSMSDAMSEIARALAHRRI